LSSLRPATLLLLATFVVSAAPASANRDLPGRQRPIAPAADEAAAPDSPADAPSGRRRVKVPKRDAETYLSHAREGSPDDLPVTVIEPRERVPDPQAQAGATVGLTLEDAIRMALAHALEIREGRLGTRSAAARAGAARGAFDPVLNARAGTTDSKRPTANPFTANESTTDDYSVSVQQKLWNGATYEVGVSASRTESPSDFFSFTPFYDTDLLLRFTQPLLRGAGRDSNKRVLDQAIRTALIADRQSMVIARDVVRDTIRAYWELVFGLRDLEVRNASLGLAQELLRKNRIMVDVGTLAPLEITQAEASVALREFEIITTRAAIGEAGDNLRRLMGVDEGSHWWDVEVVPLDEAEFVAASYDLDESLRTAMQARSEVDAADLAIESARLGVAAAKDGLLPRLDLDLSTNSAGLGGVGTLGDPDPAVDSDGDGDPTNDTTPINDDVSDAFDQTFGFDFRSWSAALTFSQPIRNRAAKGEYLAERVGLESRKLDKVQLEQTITIEVRRALRNLESARERITSARSASTLQEKTLSAEIKKFENGLSTNFEVLQFQTDLRTAQSAELRALVDYLQALADVKRARGTLLADYGLEAPR
jgi:outer membrane protein TolC